MLTVVRFSSIKFQSRSVEFRGPFVESLLCHLPEIEGCEVVC